MEIKNQKLEKLKFPLSRTLNGLFKLKAIECLETLRIHLIVCRGVQLFLRKDFCPKFFFQLEFEFLSFVTV